MNFKQVAAPFLAAFIIAFAIWATLGPAPRERIGAHKDKRHFAGPP
ncbi:MAG TPA: hypothetical protein VNX70_18955 [Bryobacteraceae bacterium]|jgi:hypothetical protein|nr:hypothetical protein [Bryobacteraceae bacterium]